jgi:hypothetical protein
VEVEGRVGDGYFVSCYLIKVRPTLRKIHIGIYVYI